VQSLAIQYLKDGRLETFYVALDSNQLADLERALIRARDKTGSLKKFFEATDLYFHEPDKERP
jgi:hypothetical protein